MLDLFIALGVLGVQTFLYSHIFCQIRGIPLKIGLWGMCFSLEIVRVTMLEASTSLAIILIEFYLIGRHILKDTDWIKSYFYASYTFVFSFSTFNFLILLSQDFLPSSFFDEHLLILFILATLGTASYHTYLLKKMKIDVLFLSKSTDSYLYAGMITPINRILSITICFLLLSHSFEFIFGQENLLFPYSKHLVFSCVLGIACFLLLIKNKLTHHKHQLRHQKEHCRLQLYIKQIEQTYQTVRGFKHDYRNILISLGESIRTGDLHRIKTLYQDILISADSKLTEEESIDDLLNVEHSALKSILYWKIREARQDGIQVNLEIKETITTVGMTSLDFIRVISILLDNAIEAAKESINPSISLAMVKEKNGHIFYLKNSRKHCPLVINQLFQPHFSTKGKHRGIGLYNLSKIIENYEHTFMETNATDTNFTQVVYIGGHSG